MEEYYDDTSFEDLDEPIITLTKRDLYNLAYIGIFSTIGLTIWIIFCRSRKRKNNPERNIRDQYSFQKKFEGDFHEVEEDLEEEYKKAASFMTKHRNHQSTTEDLIQRFTDIEAEENLERDNERDFSHLNEPPRRGKGEKSVVVSCLPLRCPPGRVGAVMGLDQETSALYLHGGVGDTHLLNDLHRFDQFDMEWEEQVASPDPQVRYRGPGARAFHAGVCVEDFLFMFGGEAQGGNLCNDFVFCHLPSKNWVKLTENKESPPARKHSTMSLWQDKDMVLFGGLGLNNKHFNDVWVFDVLQLVEEEIEEFCWRRLFPKDLSAEPGDASSSSQPKSPQQSVVYEPLGREGHCTAIVGNRLFVFGGQKDGIQGLVPQGQVEALNLCTGSWSAEPTCGRAPVLGVYESCHLVGQNIGKVVHIGSKTAGIFNKLTVLDTMVRPMCWTELSQNWMGDWTMVPGRRRLYTSVAEPTSGTIFVFGGESEGGILYNALIVLDVSEPLGIVLEEDPPDAVDETAMPREQHERSHNEEMAMETSESDDVDDRNDGGSSIEMNITDDLPPLDPVNTVSPAKPPC
mmetsp:Transcript_32179/g.42432  ORF Transcript_32179/g.42432 Transcript_32179/m.42432 type:complete len:572 (-) Transcript_32179:164-1879(-)